MTPLTVVRHSSLAAALLGACLATACGASPTSPSSLPTTFLEIDSRPGDLIGNAFRQRWGLAEAEFSARAEALFGDRQGVSVSVRPTGNRLDWWWDLRIVLPPGQPLRPGMFEGVRRWPGEGGQAGMQFSGSGRGCSFLTGRFVIMEVVVGQPALIGRIVDRLHVTFEQRCEGALEALRGEVSIVANPWR